MKKIIHALLANPSREAFGELMLRELNALGRHGEYLQEHFAIRLQGHEWVINLHNFYAEYLKAPRFERAAMLRRQASSVQAEEHISKHWSVARKNVVPVVRHRGELEYLRLRAQIEGTEYAGLLGKTFSEMLFVGIGYDTPTNIMRGPPSLLRDWGVEFDAAWAQALDNLRTLSAQERWIQVGQGVFQSNWQDGYDTSRIVLTDLIYRLPVAGRPVAFMPERNVLILTSDRDDAGLVLAAERAAKVIAEAARPLTAEVLVLSDSGWKPFALAGEAASVMQVARLKDLGQAYQSSKELMDELFDKNDVDIFVPSVMPAASPTTGEPVLVSTWTRDCDSLLPQTDVVALADGDNVLFVKWSQLVDVGAVGEPADNWWPPRYRVKAHPSKEVISRLQGCMQSTAN